MLDSAFNQSPRFAPGRQNLEEAMLEAQKLAFAPVSFMVCMAMKRMGILAALEESVGDGLSIGAAAERLDLSPYAIRVLFESALAMGALRQQDDQFHLTKLGHVLAMDTMTAVNFDFIYDVCFKGLFHLEEALKTGQPAGLKELGPWPTLYEGISELPEHIRQSWLAFDHYYSDSAFAAALPMIFAEEVHHLLDIGGNTGRFARSCLTTRSQLKVTIADLPSQIGLAEAQTHEEPWRQRLSYHPVDLLAPHATLPSGFQAVWMSQFLVCFGEEDVVRILQLARSSLTPGGRLFILDTFWDRQPKVPAYCLLQTSPYFTAIANGQSKMYDTRTIVRLTHQAGFRLENIIDNLGISHSLMVLRPHQDS
ncbi:MAG TPA: class I SAM-dependent methyltransferase [Oligoflexus sp.]|uniref:class I SAM-dependent methyltransferase n=1 Tax=Oligoflexus sp. TaxID=1971216 RepID=UPI002D6C3B44|nr:class I SAM-dependent methyltransferase [Oligoflexus sp.]HYX36053.1 class I SAM-dependent methyltransferase [Oligoflexus sp.]